MFYLHPQHPFQSLFYILTARIRDLSSRQRLPICSSTAGYAKHPRQVKLLCHSLGVENTHSTKARLLQERFTRTVASSYLEIDACREHHSLTCLPGIVAVISHGTPGSEAREQLPLTLPFSCTCEILGGGQILSPPPLPVSLVLSAGRKPA